MQRKTAFRQIETGNWVVALLSCYVNMPVWQSYLVHGEEAKWTSTRKPAFLWGVLISDTS